MLFAQEQRFRRGYRLLWVGYANKFVKRDTIGDWPFHETCTPSRPPLRVDQVILHL